MDTVSKSQRSRNMSRIKSKNTRPEMVVRRKLFQSGIRYRLHSKKLPGKPDIVIHKYKLIVDVRGCFWHGHENCRYSSTPKSNTSYWSEKIIKNKERDAKNQKILKEEGFTVFVVWECETKIEEIMNSKIEAIKSHIESTKAYSPK